MTGRRVGHFEIRSTLGEGGIGVVYAALDEELGRMVALKSLRPEVSHDQGFVERFRAEAASLARLGHPNITTLYSMHREGRDLHMVMELVDGSTLEQVLTRLGRLDLTTVRALAAQAAAGLGYAHRMGVIHRDIKPSNLMLTEGGQLKIMDFGIARIRGTARTTRAGNIVGTLAYMPPEQIKGADNDERSDIYSLACVLYEMLCGTVPFNAATEYELIQAQVSQTPPRLCDRCPDLDPAAEAVLLRALSKNPDERYATASEFARAFGALALDRDPVDIVRDNIVARMGPATPRPTRMMEVAPKPSARASVPSPPRAPKPPPGGSKEKRSGPPLPALVLGGAALLVLAGVGFVLTRRGDTTQTVVASAETAAPEPNTLDALPHSSNIFAAPDADASRAHELPAATLPACPPAADDATVARGHVAELSSEGWPQIDGKPVPLYGVSSISAAQQPALSSWLAAKGGDLVCCQVQGAYRCLTETSRQDVSMFLLMNGLARTGDGAPNRYIDAEKSAKNGQRGIWR